MLDLTALEARFQNLSLFGCKAAGGKVLLFYLSIDGREENTCWRRESWRNRKVRDSGKLWMVDFCLLVETGESIGSAYRYLYDSAKRSANPRIHCLSVGSDARR
jgi:hypothetical protein